MAEKNESYLKAKAGKPRLGMVSPYFLQEIAEVLGFGDEKHKEHDWREGVNYEALIDSIKRHIAEFEQGHTADGETGKHPLAHAASACMMLAHYDWNREQYKKFDDRRWRVAPHERR